MAGGDSYQDKEEKRMSISSFKKKCLILSAVFLIIGSVLIGAGWSMADFKAENVKEEGTPKWYRTFHADEQGTWIGIRFKKGVYLLTFGNSGEY